MNLNFSVDSGLLSELGEKLVETVHLALVELVKNAYDADATVVVVEFLKDSVGKPYIQITDNGTGMNKKAVQNYWMRIATTNKNKRKFSPVFGRPLTGAKGIGRFCCRRLGTTLTLETNGTKSGDKIGTVRHIEQTKVEFPWLSFQAGTDVTEINCVGSQKDIEDGTTGTRLIIKNISEEWTTSGYNWLKRQLAVLSANSGKSRSGFTYDPGFTVRLNSPDFSGEVIDLRNSIIEAGWGTLTARINKSHQAECTLIAKGIGTKTITSKTKFPNLKSVSLKLGILVDVKSQMRDTSILSLGNLQQILPEWGGVQVRYKGVRVYPYGDDDWLDIDYERGLRRGAPSDELSSFASTLKGVDPSRSLLNQLSMRSYIGNVEIAENSGHFEMKANREGFVSSSSLDELKEFVRFAINWTSILRDYNIRREQKKDSQKAQKDFEDLLSKKPEHGKIVDSAANYLLDQVKTISRVLPADERRIIERNTQLATDAIVKNNKANQLELTHLRLIASTSTLVLIFSHEVKTLLGTLEDSKNSLQLIQKRLIGKDNVQVDKIINSFIDLKKRLDELLSLTSVIGVNQRKNKLVQIALKDKVQDIIKVFDLIITRYEIEIDAKDIPNNLVVKNILEAELYSIILNLISNSIKAVIAGNGRKKIQIIAAKQNEKNVITIRDTGIGLSEELYDEVFKPFVSDPEESLYASLDKRLNPEDRVMVGSGSGLGLSIIKEIINARGGTIRFKKPSLKWNAEIEILL